MREIGKGKSKNTLKEYEKKKNWSQVKKNLFKKPTWREWIDTFIVLMIILMAIFYKYDIERLNKFYNETVIDYYENDCTCLCPHDKEWVPTNKGMSNLSIMLINDTEKEPD